MSVGTIARSLAGAVLASAHRSPLLVLLLVAAGAVGAANEREKNEAQAQTLPNAVVGQFAGERRNRASGSGCSATESARLSMTTGEHGLVSWDAHILSVLNCKAGGSTSTSCWYHGGGILEPHPAKAHAYSMSLQIGSASSTPPPNVSERLWKCGPIEIVLPNTLAPQNCVLLGTPDDPTATTAAALACQHGQPFNNIDQLVLRATAAGLRVESPSDRPIDLRRVETSAAPAEGTSLSRLQVNEGIVIDTVTGIAWQQLGLSGLKMTIYGAREYCADLKLGGKTGWRLPTRGELVTILLSRRDHTPPLIDATAFPSTPADVFWADPGDDQVGLDGVDFNSGDVIGYPSKHPIAGVMSDDPVRNFVRCVWVPRKTKRATGTKRKTR